ncbi:MAG: lipid-A-disaccharide synthase [Polyangiaceae bacterium]|nr:lipid-A-disaccharide synthase [Polyangiaceae bacterium]
MTLLVSAGEASGDALAAPVVRALGARAFGLGGRALGDAGADVVVDLASLTGMGIGAVVSRAPAIARAAHTLLSQAKSRHARAALLVGYSEFNAWLAPRLRARGLKVLWYAPPQIWAWRKGRAASLSRGVDRMALLFPFEEALWQSHGVDAHFVGHPALERVSPPRDAIRQRLGLAPWAEYVAILPGSRPEEVKHHLGPMLAALGILRADRGALDARVIVAPSLDRGVSDRIGREATAAGVAVVLSSAPSVLPAFDVALAASGTVTLECAAAEVPPVLGYRVGPVTELLARRLLEVELIGLPNLILGERVFPELLQAQFTAEALAEEAGRLLDERAAFVRACRDVKASSRRDPLESSKQVARLMAPWLS